MPVTCRIWRKPLRSTSSFARRPAERRRSLTAAALVALLGLAVADGAAAETALETCAAAELDAAALDLCLDGLAAEAEAELEQVYERARVYFQALDAITGNARADRTLAQAQTAFTLFRDLDCHLLEIDQGIGSAALAQGRACRIDHDRARIASLIGLVGEPEAGATADHPLFGTEWRVVEIEGEATAEEIETTLDIDEDGAIAGIGGCNRYFGSLGAAEDGVIMMSEIGTTRMACDEPIMAQEIDYFDALGRVTGFSLEDGALELADQDGEVVIRLEPRAG